MSCCTVSPARAGDPDGREKEQGPIYHSVQSLRSASAEGGRTFGTAGAAQGAVPYQRGTALHPLRGNAGYYPILSYRQRRAGETDHGDT